jgi:hypothetical protein
MPFFAWALPSRAPAKRPAAAIEPARSTSRRVKPHPHPMMEFPPAPPRRTTPRAARSLRYENIARLYAETISDCTKRDGAGVSPTI